MREQTERASLPRVGPYRLLRLLGAGGMGSVWAAHHEGLGVTRALKLLPADADPELILRFEREGQALAAIAGHPHLVRVHELGVDGARRYLVMELVEGASLEARLREGPLEPADAAALVRDLARALAHAHACGVLHRDVKPANVVFDPRGTPVLVDFGLARVQDAASLTASGQLLGTPACMAPEQVRGSREGLGPATDVYGLGAVLYAALTGRLPFEGPLLSVLASVIERPPTAPRQLRPAVPAWLEAVCLRALAKDPGARYPDCLALAAALAGPAAPARRRRSPVWVALSVGALGVPLLTWWSLSDAAPDRSAATSPEDPVRPAPAHQAPPVARPDPAAIVAASRLHPERLEEDAAALAAACAPSGDPTARARAISEAAGDELQGIALRMWAARALAAAHPRAALALLDALPTGGALEPLLPTARGAPALETTLLEPIVQLALANGREDAALALADRALQADRTSSRLRRLWTYLHWCHLGGGRQRSHSEELLELDPGSWPARVYRLDAVSQVGDEAERLRRELIAGCRDKGLLHAGAYSGDLGGGAPLLDHAYRLSYPFPVSEGLIELRGALITRLVADARQLAAPVERAAVGLPPSVRRELQVDLAELESVRKLYADALRRCEDVLREDPCQARATVLAAHAILQLRQAGARDPRLSRSRQRELYRRYLLLCRPDALHEYERLDRTLRLDQAG